MLPDPLMAYAARSGVTEPELLQLAESRFNREEAGNVFRRFLDAATAGSPFAMCICARSFRNGRGTEKSEQSAFVWAEKAAQTGFAPGLFELGECFEHGIGTPTDVDRAVKLYELAADAGFGFAAHRLGAGYYSGLFGTTDVPRAIAYMERADQLGDAHGAADLAEWYESGAKVPRDYVAAVRWYKRAAELGDPFSSQRLQMAHSQGELGLPRDAALAREYEKLFMEQTA